MRTINGTEGLQAAVGTEAGRSGRQHIGQAEITAFAEASGHRYWIRTDAKRAARSSLGSNIVHGRVSLGVSPMLELRDSGLSDPSQLRIRRGPPTGAGAREVKSPLASAPRSIEELPGRCCGGFCGPLSLPVVSA
jgi:acyl dehydratase